MAADKCIKLKKINSMKHQEKVDYQRIEKAIRFICEHFQQQPTLEEIAAEVHVSPYHFQRMFHAWAGISPKKFMQYISLDHAKKLLNKQMSLMDVAAETGLSGTSRLHDLFVNIEGMTPGEYKKGGKGMAMNYSFTESPFGPVMIASTDKGVCYLNFENDSMDALKNLKAQFPEAIFHQTTDNHQMRALSIFHEDWSQLDAIKLHLAGTPFQIKVWESLLKIPMGTLWSYGSIAKNIGQPKASRAVGTAIGCNPIAFIIPCHRVIQSNGKIGGYKWGTDKKTALIGWEAAKMSTYPI
jgi:AraC family transcriptional regulator of adaptative response/methylated-DNA-[protein]-cysteine methyltransferase